MAENEEHFLTNEVQLFAFGKKCAKNLRYSGRKNIEIWIHRDNNRIQIVLRVNHHSANTRWLLRNRCARVE